MVSFVKAHLVPAQPWAPFLLEGVSPSILLWLHSHLLFLPLFFYPSVLSLFFSSIIKYFSPHFSLLSPFPPIFSLLSVLLQTLDNQLKSV